MTNIISHLGKNYFVVCESMLAYYDGKQVRKNRRFLKALWQLLQDKNNATVEDVIESMDNTTTKTTKQMIKSNIKRGGWRWLEGEEGNIFGARFVNEYIRRCEILENSERELLENSELIEIAGRMIDRVNHHNYPDLFPDIE